ncbi:MAG TPA: AraC family transcriptional regulator [Burkholderiaceae bacterium]|nr:AraC family transcriptional regulator [Burkholderiaceae bacterium]
MPLIRERLYPSYKIAALVRLLAEDGVPAARVLRDTGLHAEALEDVTILTSIEQYLLACRNAMQHSHDRSIPFRLGGRLHLSDHGMVGLLLLSCESVRDYFVLAEKYQSLATPTVAFEGDTNGRHAAWIVCDESPRELPTDLRPFIVEQHFAQHVTHLQDVLGAPCRPTLACFAYAAPPHRALYEQYLRCPCVFDWHRTEIRFAKEILERRPYLANPLASTMLRSTCDGMLADIEASLGFAGKVYRTLCHLRDPGAGMKVVASALQMNARTLRRRLSDEGTCFSTIAHNVKYGVATQHLKESGISIEQVAAIAGFSDPANFRRAFIRWTSMSPAQFRRLQHR